jgi:hypothetical protein
MPGIKPGMTDQRLKMNPLDGEIRDGKHHQAVRVC